MENNKNNTPEQNESNSAKRIRMLGDNMSESIHLKSDAEVKGDFWANIWYRNKWAIIFGSIAVVMIIILCITLFNRAENDMKIMYAGPKYLVNDVPVMNEKLSQICSDYDENGEVTIAFPTVTYLNEKQREEVKKDIFDAYERAKIDSANIDALNQFELQLMSGEVVIYLLDPELYELKAKNMCISLKDVLGHEVSSQIRYDDNAIYFAKTDFAKYFSDFKALPADTVMCVAGKSVSVDEELLEDSKDFFKRIVEFKAN